MRDESQTGFRTTGTLRASLKILEVGEVRSYLARAELGYWRPAYGPLGFPLFLRPPGASLSILESLPLAPSASFTPALIGPCNPNHQRACGVMAVRLCEVRLNLCIFYAKHESTGRTHCKQLNLQ